MIRSTAETRSRLRAAGLALPLVAFVGVTFVAPLVSMMVRSVYDPVVADALPETLALLDDWDGMSVPEEAVFESAVRELVNAQQERVIGQIAGRVNRVQGGLRSVLVVSARRLGTLPATPGVTRWWKSIRPGKRSKPGMRCARRASASPRGTIWRRLT